MLRFADAWWPLALATMAGLSTSVGAILAVVRKPSARAMAALLGVALGVMATVSAVELLARNAMEAAARHAETGGVDGDPVLVLVAAAGGALSYYLLEPFFPKMDEQHDHIKKQDDPDDHEAFFRSLQPQRDTAAGGGQPGGHSAAAAVDMERSGHSGAAQRKLVTATAGHAQLAGGGGLLGCSGSTAGDALPLLASPRGGDSLGGSQAYGAGHNGLARTSSGVAADGLTALLSVDSGGAAAGGGGSGGTAASLAGPGGSAAAAAAAGGGGPASALLTAPGGGRGRRAGATRMLRLGLLMAVTMTLHNLPEGFAVAFSAFTDFGPVMALAIALHNIPEGVIVAAPIFAATGSRLRAIGVATASGLSEPLGALLSLLLLQPFFSQERLQYLLAFVGGVMLAVCAIELWPEGRNCRHDRAFAAGIVGGSAVMGWTLYVEG